MSGHCLSGGTQYFDDFVLPLRALLIDRSRHFGTALTTIGAQQTYPPAVRYVLKSDTECMVTSVAFVAEHHFVLVVRLSAVDTRLTVHTLPLIETDGINHFVGKLQTRRMSAIITIRTVEEIFIFKSFTDFADGVGFHFSDQLWRTAVFTFRTVVVVVDILCGVGATVGATTAGTVVI